MDYSVCFRPRFAAKNAPSTAPERGFPEKGCARFLHLRGRSDSVPDEANGSRSGMCTGDRRKRRNAMRKTVHLCLSSHDEVMFRSEADLTIGFNCFALAALTTESRALAEGRMSTHHHSMAQTDNAKELMYRNRNAYSRYFNTTPPSGTNGASTPPSTPCGTSTPTTCSTSRSAPRPSIPATGAP